MSSAPTVDDVSSATLRRRAELAALAGVALLAAALVLADPRLAAPARVTRELVWPASLAELAATAVLLSCMLAGVAASTGNANRVHGLVSLVAVGAAAAGVYWMSQFSNATCSGHTCPGLVTQTANWWAYWILIAAAAGCAELSCRVAADVSRR